MTEMSDLLELMARLRDPENGCPWDKQQTFKSILPYTLEEVYEVADAIDQDDMVSLREELGDLLFQIVFYAQMAKEAGEFEFADVAVGVHDKLVQRHPHVFSGAEIESVEAQNQAWEKHKESERQTKAAEQQRMPSVLDNVPLAIPALMRSVKLQRRAARSGFDWPAVEPVLAKIEEELAEVREVLAGGGDADKLTHEVGDLLFACTNLARHVSVDPEVAMRGINHRFESRFRRVEELARQQNQLLPEMSLEEMDKLWDQAKAEEATSRES
ncbi:MAG TPA: nucleoside triphosphate pyrophosphohydrolase [Candidatus Tenderia electrophaga]|uniref:Nucleoside triphosphate pyrophosphohydrolase n=1 Tax=Candidatus Tenderia electrophaga TaxID=1748243 RepID=A0A832J9T8_9GAMM|nr:nucleoside triphosphate pyrophosphohydrolase [Candidatus Tenderia electrophaga]